jgi:DNA-binding CsgD family transcriptional regulator
MFDMTPLNSSLGSPDSETLPRSRMDGYAGPERRAAPSRARHWLAATLDEIDYGMLLLHDGPHVLQVNHAARAELDGAHPLQLLGRELRARHSHDVVPLADALRGASQRGLRRLLTLGDGEQRASVSVVPLPAGDDTSSPVTLLILGKRQVCELLTVQGFARSHGLTSAETRVLAALCQGTPPAEIAVQVGVAISTVRTQISTIRGKTGTESIRELVRQVAVLPPLMGVLRGVAGQVCGACDTVLQHA